MDRGGAQQAAELARHHRMVHRRQRVDLAPQAAQAGLVVHAARTHHLHHGGAVGDLVEGEVRLVRRPTAEQPHGGQLGGDGVTFVQAPGVLALG